MTEFLIGVFITTCLFILINFSKKKQLKLSLWQWILTIGMFVYSTFVLAVIASFLEEEAVKAALVTSIVFGFIAVVWGVLLTRFVFFKKIEVKNNES